MYRVKFVNRQRYPHIILELQDTATEETKWWCLASSQYDELCQQLGVTHLKGCTLPVLPVHGGWIAKEDIYLL